MSDSLRHDISGAADRPALVLLHALGTTRDLWWPQLPALASAFRVVNVDLPGHGSSSMPRPGASISDLAGEIAGLIRNVAPAGAHVAGISTGGMIAQSLAIEHPSLVRSLALCNTTSVVPHLLPACEDPALFVSRKLVIGAAARARLDGMGAIAPLALQRWFRPNFLEGDPVSIRRVERMILGNQPEGYARVCEAISRFDVTDQLHRIRMPVVVIAGSHDPGTPLACSRVIVARIRGAELVVIEDSAHISNVERPNVFTAALLAFVSRTAATRGERRP